ncbi:hypothetical protein FHT72_006392 [Rhizobium sp. BK077]|uniref:hypothetical protein n=1 Tax=unclassified Rhizobium TaxID=2613769 RepID=UPI00161E186B|nr:MULTISPECIES: hypothetical protein [unclassified Rhizobium]MBB3302967.1 hypothetical protein [Rhizobium sp. BK112]MBB3371860.1 hypothetical protein [Rhizobium sp. BK077]MBB4182827.1 hypothetical protein [Rhizobium sp. BK109]
MLALKLTLVPLCLLAVSISGKWWGPAIAGWLAGLPLIAGPILFLIVLEHGPIFGAQAAALSLSAILASEAFNFAYAWSCRSRHWLFSLSLGMLTWLFVASGLSMLPASPVYGLGAALLAIVFGQAFLPDAKVVAKGAPLTGADLVGRMFVGCVLTLVVTTLSSVIGATWSGLLAVFPLLGIVLSVSSHRTYGPDFVVSLLRGMILGRFSFAAFCLCLTLALPAQTTSAAFVEAAVLAMLVQYATKRLADRPRSPLPQNS